MGYIIFELSDYAFPHNPKTPAYGSLKSQHLYKVFEDMMDSILYTRHRH